MFLRFAVYAGAATCFAGTAYTVGLSYAPAPTYKVSDEKRATQFNKIAPNYESKTRKQEFYLGIGRLRRRLLKEEAYGRVLEVGAGTGNNIELYPNDKVEEVILADRTPAMVTAMKAKIDARLGYQPFVYADEPWNPASPTDAKIATTSSEGGTPTTTEVVSDTHRKTNATPDGERIPKNWSPPEVAEMVAAGAPNRENKKSPKVDMFGRADPTERKFDPKGVCYSVGRFPSEDIPFEDDSFDTVVDMFGLCSYNDPVKAMKEMARVCKPGGKMVLLEHGRGNWGTVNQYLDKWAPRHANMWGCWWNRDIRRYLRMSGCKVIHREEKHFGTTQVFILTPFKQGKEPEQLQEVKKRKQEREERIALAEGKDSLIPR